MNKHSATGAGRQAGTRGAVAIRAAGRVVGHVAGDAFHKSIVGSKHMLRKPPALALDLDSLSDAEQAGAAYVEIEDTESGKVYRAAVGTIRARGWNIDRSFGRQIALSLAEWRRDDEPAGEQLSLWGAPA